MSTPKTPGPAASASSVDGLLATPLTMRDRIALFRVAYFTPGVPNRPGQERMGLPLYLVGGVGVSKTSTTRAFAASLGVPVEVFSPSERGDAEIGSVPVPVEGGRFLTTPVPMWARPFLSAEDAHTTLAGAQECPTQGRGLILADELTTAAPHVQDALAGLVLDQRIAGRQLAPGVRVWAAGNPPGASGSGRPLRKMLANRLIHVPVLPPTPAEVLAYLTGDAAPTTAGTPGDAAREGAARVTEADRDGTTEARVLAAWSAVWARVTAVWGQFMSSAGRGHLCCEPDDDGPEASGPFPTPRSWETCLRALTGALILDAPVAVQRALVLGSVGHAAGLAFLDYADDLGMPDVRDVLDGVAPLPVDRADRILATLSACVQYLAAERGAVAALDAKSRPARAASLAPRMVRLWEMLTGLLDTAPDLAGITASKAQGASLQVCPGLSGEGAGALLRVYTATVAACQQHGIAGIAGTAARAL